MPFKTVKTKSGNYKLYNLDKKKYAKPTFKTKESANNMKAVYMKYDSTKKKK